MPCHVAVSVRTTFFAQEPNLSAITGSGRFRVSAEWSGIAIPQVEIESGLQVSASTCNPSHEVMPVLPRVLEEFGESDLFGEVKQHAGVR